MDRDVTFGGTRRMHETNVIYGETSSMIEPARAWRASWAMQK
jgi:hypothetical protein